MKTLILKKYFETRDTTVSLSLYQNQLGGELLWEKVVEERKKYKSVVPDTDIIGKRMVYTYNGAGNAFEMFKLDEYYYQKLIELENESDEYRRKLKKSTLNELKLNKNIKESYYAKDK